MFMFLSRRIHNAISFQSRLTKCVISSPYSFFRVVRILFAVLYSPVPQKHAYGYSASNILSDLSGLDVITLSVFVPEAPGSNPSGITSCPLRLSAVFQANVVLESDWKLDFETGCSEVFRLSVSPSVFHTVDPSKNKPFQGFL
jgi:hypothetical protein